jgi:tRNA (guanine-N(7)-)-methyltransferase
VKFRVELAVDIMETSGIAHLLPSLPERYIDRDEVTEPVTPEGWFGGVRAPLEVEIGCGNGRFLQRACATRPDHLFIGVERALTYARLAQERVLKYQMANVRIVRTDAVRLLTERVPENAIHTLHVYFTDPWPKRKHAKRRLFQTPFLETVHRVMRPGGMVRVKVDLFWYFEEIFGRFERSPFFRVVSTSMDTERERNVRDVTGFEDKALRRKGATFALDMANVK